MQKQLSLRKKQKRTIKNVTFIFIWVILLVTLLICIYYSNQDNLANATLAQMLKIGVAL